MSGAPRSDVTFLPLGGCGEIGMNCNLFGHDGQWIAVDCGITLEQAPGALRPSVQMPDLSFISARREQLRALIITHAHEDHLGALPYLWEQLRCPVYATPFAAAVLRHKTRNRRGTLPSSLIEVEPGERTALGPFDVEWLPITHSTPETCALSITVGDSRIFHTADWKIDNDPVVGPAWCSRRFRELGEAGIDAVICDSTNALRGGYSPTEGQVAAGLAKVIQSCEGRVVVGCFSSNVARMQTLATIAAKTGRYLGVLGRSAAGMARCAQQVGLLSRDFQPIHAEHLGYLPPAEVLAVATGSQGEWGAALHRLLTQTHPDLSLDAGDTVILSSKTIPGNEASVARLVDGLRARDIRVIAADDSDEPLHASGHPCQGEWGAALHRLLTQTHPDLSLDAGDTVILSSKTIPGNEASVTRLVDGLRARDIRVIAADDSGEPLHASGHPCQGELADLYRLLKPALAIPVHGEQAHMAANAKIARDAGVSSTLTGRNGDLFYLSPTPGVRRRFAKVGRLAWCEETERLIGVTQAPSTVDA